MANWGQAFTNLGAGLGDISTLVKHLEFMKAQQAEETRRQLIVQAQAAANERAKEVFLDPTKGAPVQSRLEGGVLKDISSADNLNKLPSEIEMLMKARASGMDTSAQTGMGLRTDFNGMRPEINDLMAARNAAEARLTKEANVPDTPIQQTLPDGSQTTQFVSKRAGGTYNTGLSAAQTGANKGTEATAAAPGTIAATNAVNAGTMSSAASMEGAKAKARSDAELPNQIKIAKVRADIHMKQLQDIDAWKQLHPAATTQERNKASNAITALGSIGEARQMLDYLDTKGIVGPVQGRIAQVAAGKIKSEDLINTLIGDGVAPDDARIASDYFSSMKLLSSLAAVTHGGARGGGSVELTKQFQQMLSGIGDKNVISGQLDAMERLMNHYKEHPSEPIMFEIPGLTTPAGPAGPSAAEQKAKARGF